MHAAASFDPRQLAVKLRRVAAELRQAPVPDLSVERFARRLEAHAEAMLHPERTPEYRPFARENMGR